MPIYFRAIYLLTRLEKTNLIAYSSIVAGFINIMLNLWLVPIYGIEGAAVTTMISYLVLCFLSTIFYNRSKF